MARQRRGEPKVSYGVRVKQHVYEEVSRIAAERHWSESQTTDELLTWTVTQLKAVGSFDALLDSQVVPSARTTARTLLRKRAG